jgi:hypothetical protein
MNSLMKERSNYSTDEEFQNFAVAEVRRFIADLRSINIELSLRPPAKALYAVSEKLAQ